jgi:hypothetical protein
MAYTTETSNSELTRVGTAAFQGKRVRISLALLDTEGFDKNSTRANWDSIKVSGGGYADVTFVVPAGEYKTGSAQFEAAGTSGAAVNATFTATGVGFQYNRVVHVIGTSDGMGGWTEETFISYLGVESTDVTVSAGQSVTYPITLFVND